MPPTPVDMTPMWLESEEKRKDTVSSRRLSRFVEIGSVFRGKGNGEDMEEEALDWDEVYGETGCEERLTSGKGRERLRLGVRKGLVSILDLTDKMGGHRDAGEKKRGKEHRWWKVWPHGRRAGK
jgi:hypothetical protein